MKKTYSSTRAFTLIELSAAILIIGILIAGVMGATSLVKKSKIVAAQSLTKTSPIAVISDNALWLESGSESSFKDTESSTGDSVTTWYDQKNAVNKSSVVAVGTGPTYSNTINYIHAVKFSGSTANYLQVADASFLNNTDYTILVLEKRQSSTAGYFIGDSSVLTANQTLLLGYSAEAAIAHSQGTGNVYNSNVSTYSSSSDTPRIFTFVSDSINGKKTYINGILAAQSADVTKLSNITTLAIGKGYTGEIGEIAIFTRALKSEERKATEDYLGKKYSVEVNRATAASESCINGIVTTNGCATDCSTSSVVGLSSPSTVSDGASNVTGTCGVTGYSGTVTLSCGSGTGVLTSSPSMCGCNTGAGYSLSGGVCISNCSYTVTGGSPSTGTVSAGPVSITCDTTKNYSSTPFTATCSGGTAITGTCACATGYTGAGCSACNTANGYVSGGGGTCILGCTVPAGSGTTLTTVVRGTTSTGCDASGYSGTLSYTCSTGGVPITVVTPCSQTCVATGTSGTASVTPDTTTVLGLTIFKLTAGSYTFTCPIAKTAQVLVVAGGGGGANGGGGGGGGGVVYKSSHSISANSSTSVSVGAGGAGLGATAGVDGNNGVNSSFGSIVAYGGGGGGFVNSTPKGKNGGSGGGAARDYVATTGGTATKGTGGTALYGNAGGGGVNAGWSGAGGGGGAGGAGSKGFGNGNASDERGGAGGAGQSITIAGSTTIYAGGGGGSTNGNDNNRAPGGSGGGGAGGGGNIGVHVTDAVAGAANTGGGGGGSPSNSGAGGSGIVIITY